MGDDDQRRPGSTLCAQQKIENGPGVDLVQLTRGLVREDQARPVDEGTRDRDPLTLSAGELVGELVALVPEAQLGEQLEAARVPLGIGAVQGELQADVLDRGEEGQQVVGLEDEPERGPAQAGPLGTRHARDLLSADQHAAGGR